MGIISKFKSLPISSRRLLSLGIIFGLVVALPLFIWAIINLTFDQRERAATGEPSVCIANNKIITVTPIGGNGSCHDIQTAINAVNGPDFMIKLAPGTYNVYETGETYSINIINKNNLLITGDSAQGNQATVISFTGNRGGINVSNSSGAIEWVTIQGNVSNGLLDIKAGYNDFSVRYSKLIATTSHALSIYDSMSASIVNVDIRSSAGAIEVGNSTIVNISNCVVHDSANAITYYNSSGKIFSNLIYNNRENGISLNKPISLEIYSNTIADNGSSDNTSAGININNMDANYATIINIYKNIVARNKFGIKIASPSLMDTFHFSFNDIWGNTQGNYSGISSKTGVNGNISLDPLFGEMYCVYRGSPVLYGLVSNGEYMGSRLYCSGSSPTPTPKACNESCNSTVYPPISCQNGLSCYTTSTLRGASGVCRNLDCSSETDCTCPQTTVTPTPTATPTTAPIGGGEPNSCGGTCGSNYNCKANFFCYQGYCRNPLCASDSNCDCITSTATATSRATSRVTTKPRVTSTPSPKGGNVTSSPSYKILTTLTPEDTSLPEDVVSTEPENKFFTKYALPIFAVFALIVISTIYYAVKKNKEKIDVPHITPPVNL